MIKIKRFPIDITGINNATGLLSSSSNRYNK